MSNLITKLNNPLTDNYIEFKKIVLSTKFQWFYRGEHIPEGSYEPSEEYYNGPIYGHTLLARPSIETKFISRHFSDHMDLAAQVFLEIFEHNNISFNYFLRINANVVHPEKEVLKTVPHVDHFFDHKNALIYLTDAGGQTIVGKESHDPKEDDVIIFGGETHYIKTPESKRRVVLVATYN